MTRHLQSSWRTFDINIVFCKMSYVLSARHMPTAGSNVPKPVVFVIGSSGNVGKATVNALSIKYGRKLDIRAGVRNPETVTVFKHLTGVTIVEAEMGQYEILAKQFKGVNALLIVTPSTQNRAELVQKTAEAAKDAGVLHIVVISGTSAAGNNEVTFGQQFRDIEQAVLNLGVSYTILRLPWFMENYFSFKHSIQEDLVFHAPVNEDKQFQVVCMDDVGAAAATILASPEKHAGKIYSIVSDRNTFAQVSEAFSRALSREVTYVRVSYDDARKKFLEMGFPSWRVDGVIQFYETVDDGSDAALGGDEDFKEITGKNPTKLLTWMNRFASALK